MKWFWVLSTVVLGALAGATLLNDPGYVLIRAGDLVFESSIAAGVLTLLMLVSIVFVLYAGVRRLLLSAGVFAKWRAERQHSKASDSWQQGVLAFARGDLRGAAMAVKSARVESDRQLEALLIQAWHFVQAGDDSALQQLQQSVSANQPQHSESLELGVARWQLQTGVFDGAATPLAKLPRSTEQAGLLLWSHIQKAEWSAVSSHWPVAERQGVLKAETFRGQMPLLRAGKAMADSIAVMQHDEPAWRIGLKGMPKQWQVDATTVGLFADMLATRGKPQAARQLIQQVLSKRWLSGLVRAYGQISSAAQLPAAIEQLQGWLAKKADDPELLLALGRLSRANGQHTQAYKHLVLAAKTVGSALQQAGSESSEGNELLQLITLELGKLNLTSSVVMNASGASS
jgi:HemY protein